jgi:hypothetical protein
VDSFDWMFFSIAPFAFDWFSGFFVVLIDQTMLTVPAIQFGLSVIQSQPVDQFFKFWVSFTAPMSVPPAIAFNRS